MPAYDSVVIGGGASGMSAAIALAKMGRKTALVEASSRLAPTLQGFRRKGLFFDTGVHYVGELGQGHVLDTYFRFLGIRQDLQERELPVEGFLGVRSPDIGEDFFVSHGPDRLKHDLFRLRPGREREVRAFFRECRNYWTSSPYLTFRETGKSSLESYIRQNISVGHFLRENVPDPGLRAIFSYPAILAGVEPCAATLQVHAQIFGSYLRSVHHIRGGGVELVRAFSRSLERNGVDVFLGNRASRLELDDLRQVNSVHLADGQKLRTSTCVYTGSPTLIPNLLAGRGLRPAQQQRFAGMRETMSGFVVYARLKGSDHGIMDVPNWLVLRDRGWLRFVGVEEKDGPSGLHLSLTEEENGEIGVIVIAPSFFSGFEKWADTTSGRRPADYKEYKTRLADKLLDAVSRQIPELKGRLEPVAASTPLTFRDYCGTPRGGLYGTCKSVDQYPLLPMTKIPGLFLAGQGVIAPGVLGAVISGMVACGMIVGEKELLEQVVRCKCKEL